MAEKEKAMKGMTTAANEMWRERVRKEDKVLRGRVPPPFNLNPKTLWAAPVPSVKHDPRLARGDCSEEVFARYDADNNGHMDIRELKTALRDLHVNVSDENAAKLQREIDVNGDGIVSIPEVTDWWKKKQEKMNEKLYKDPTAEWGNAPGTTSREVGWFIARRQELCKVRAANQAKWRTPKVSCDETLYSTEYVKFAGKSPFSNKQAAGSDAK